MRKLFKADLAVAVLVGFHDGLVDDLLQLDVLQVVTDHHLEHDEELAVGDISVAVDIVDSEGEAQLLLLVTLGAEGRQTSDELLEIDVTTTVLVEDGNHSEKKPHINYCPAIGALRGRSNEPGGKRVGRDLRQGEELVSVDSAGGVL